MTEFQKMVNQLLEMVNQQLGELRKAYTAYISQIEAVQDALRRVDLSQLKAELDVDLSPVEALRDELKRLQSINNQVAKAMEQAAEPLIELQKHLELLRKFMGQGNQSY